MSAKVNQEEAQRSYLAEHEAKKLLASYGIRTTKEILVSNESEALRAADQIGYPVVLKGAGEAIRHKTELGLVRTGIPDPDSLRQVLSEMASKKVAGLEGYLVQEMIEGDREFIVGLNRDPQFGPVVLFGLGGIYAEVMRDTSFRVAPLDETDAREMFSEIKASALLGDFRGQPPVDRDELARILVTVGKIGMERKDIVEIDINPLKVSGGALVAVDALIGIVKG